MKLLKSNLKKYYSYLILISTITILDNCASISPPQGGLKDIKPPVIVQTRPYNNELNYKKDKIIIQFNERIDTKELKNNLIINPKIIGDYETETNNNDLVIKFPKGYLQKSNCKTFSMDFQKGIKDANEGNLLTTDKLIFSNCNSIDSGSVKGFVVDAYSRDTLKNIFIGLYSYTDTLNIDTQKPDYYGFTNEKGLFFIEFIKLGIYKILAFEDKNKNFILDSRKEKLGFLKENIMVDSSKGLKIELLLSLNDVKKPTINSIKDDAEIILKLDDVIKDYKVECDSKLYYQLAENKKEIIIYKNTFDKDTLPVKLYLQDSSLNDTIINLKILRTDTSKIKHIKNIIKNKKEEFLFNDTISYKLSFINPVIKTDYNKLYFTKDSTEKIVLSEKNIQWNKTKDEATINYIFQKTAKKQVILTVENKAFYSVKNDTNAKVIVTYKVEKPKKIEEENYATFLINTTKRNYFVEILNDKGKIYNKTKNKKTIRLSNIPNGKYSVRVWIDENDNDYWNVGHYKNNTLPEKSLLFKNVMEVKTNWDIEDININF